jgi:hypothetical protein
MPLALGKRATEARRVLRAGIAAVAMRLQEAADSADALGARAIEGRLSDALRDHFQGSGSWGYYVDHFGDGESGDVIYSCGGETMKAPYAMTTVGGKVACEIDTAAAAAVTPRTIYEEEADDEDHYAAMESAKLYRSKHDVPLYERFISKDERANASAGSFAGKGKSFPILKPGDVMAAVRSMGRAGSGNYSTDTIKANIIRIAKAKGWAKELPKAWQDDTAKGKESARSGLQSEGSAGSTALKLVESSAFPVDIPLREAFKENYRIKLIGVGKGSTAWYTPEALKQAASDKIFKAGTPMRIDHPTATQEAERPEGSVKDWGAVLKSDALWMESGPAGAGLYSDVKPFSDHAQTIDEKGPYAGVSIAAFGEALKDSAGKAVMRDGVPVLAKFTSADGVDMVTRAGAGGLFLTEAARPAVNSNQEDSMEAAELQKLQESNRRLLERAIRADAREEASKILKTTSLVEAARERVIDAVSREFSDIPQTSEGALDVAKFTETVNAAAKAEGAYVASLLGSGRVAGMGAPAPIAIDAKEAERRQADSKRLRESRVRSFIDLGMPKDAAERAADRDVQEVA